jgi:hypothetical protein
MKSEAGDPVLAALAVAAEDDALKSKSTVALPVDAFSKRLDGMVTHLSHQLARDGVRLEGPEHAAEYLKNVLFGSLGFRVATGDMELYRPYRIYMHNVLTQRMGTPAALGALLTAFVQRAQAAGLVYEFPVEVMVPSDRNVPEVRPAQVRDYGNTLEWCVASSSCLWSSISPVMWMLCACSSRVWLNTFSFVHSALCVLLFSSKKGRRVPYSCRRCLDHSTWAHILRSAHCLPPLCSVRRRRGS